ncbi:MAG: disulfide bond formation protein B, partial [Ilumatobacter sp.]|nr:disulfide bond formation protein B [Ilumatobacter sp.]
MDASTVATVFALALFAGLVGIVVAVFNESVRAVVRRRALMIAGSVAVAATLGSLYFSEVADFIPCKLCWYQRIAMYPLAVLLVMAAVRRDQSMLLYVRVIALLGLAVSAYHVWIQWFPEKSNFCEFDNPCSARWVEAFDRVTIPQMAGLSFVLIIATATIGLRPSTESQASEESVA